MSSTLALALAVAALLVGPAMTGFFGHRARLLALLDGFVLAMVGGLCLVNLLPEAYAVIGPWAFAVALLGLLLPQLAEHRIERHAHGEPIGLLLLAVIGLSLHHAVDGASLAVDPQGVDGAQGQARLGVALAIILHQLPVGLFVWWSLQPKWGGRWASVVLAALAALTGVGYALAHNLHELSHGVAAGVITALLSGGLLHIVSGHGALAGSGHAHRSLAGVGALVGIALLPIVALDRHRALMLQALESSTHLLVESGLAIVLGFLGAGLLSLVPTETLARLMRGRNPFESALRGVVFGLPLPVCSCGVVPLYRSLARKGVPPAAALAFLVATPELGMDSIVISLPLLGVKLAVLRLVAALLVAMAAGLIASSFTSSTHATAGDSVMVAAASGPKWRRALRYGFGESVDELGPWILAGLCLAGFLEPLLSPDWIGNVPRMLEAPLFAAIGAPLYLCASGATPVAAVLLAKGLSTGAILAFLIAGPATNVTTFGAIRGSHSRGATWLLVVTIPLLAVLVGWLLNGFGPSAVEVAALHQEHPHAAWRWVFAGAFLLLLVTSLLRQGPRGFLRQLGIGEEAERCEDPCAAPEVGQQEHAHASRH
jgi:uncharacterized membrane protein YraQ (UPF0718 family)